MVASTFFAGLHLPYWEYWVPFSVGISVGGLFLLSLRFVGKRPAPVATAPRVKPSQEYDPFVQGSPTEQRKAHRRGGNPVEVLLAEKDSDSPHWRGWVLDRSVGGLCLGVPQEIPEGTVLRVFPVHAPAITPWTAIEVRSCRSSKDGFEIGCQFVRQPPWAVLLLFG
jgi:PilZ domain